MTLQNSLIDTFQVVHLQNLGAPGVLMGTARLLTCLAELPAFRMSGRVMEVLGVSGSFALAQACYVVRFLYYTYLGRIAKALPIGVWAVLPIELLHGIASCNLYGHPFWIFLFIENAEIMENCPRKNDDSVLKNGH